MGQELCLMVCLIAEARSQGIDCGNSSSDCYFSIILRNVRLTMGSVKQLLIV